MTSKTNSKTLSCHENATTAMSLDVARTHGPQEVTLLSTELRGGVSLSTIKRFSREECINNITQDP